MNALWAALPIVVALGCMAARLASTWAALLALIAALAIALTAFEASVAQLVDAEAAIAGVMIEIALILFGALLLSAVLQRAGSQGRIGRALIARTANTQHALVLVVLGIIPFAESVTGFGVGAIIGVPLLRELGLEARRSAVCALLGLVIVPWGSLGPGTLVAARLGQVDLHALGVTSAALSGVVFFVMGAAALIVAYGRAGLRRGIVDLSVTAGTLWLGVWLANRWLGTPLAGVLGSLLAIVVALARARHTRRRAPPLPVADALPYALLVAGLLLGNGLPAGRLQPVAASPATWLLLTALAAPAVLRIGRAPTAPVLATALAQWRPVAAPTVAFLALGVVLAASGMSHALAAAGARLGDGYPLVAPWLGALGGFLTGSNTGASSMFAASQAETAKVIGYPVLFMVGLQNVGASLAVMAALPKIVMATTVAVSTAIGTPAGGRPTVGSVLWPILAADAVALCGLSLISLLG